MEKFRQLYAVFASLLVCLTIVCLTIGVLGVAEMATAAESKDRLVDVCKIKGLTETHFEWGGSEFLDEMMASRHQRGHARFAYDKEFNHFQAKPSQILEISPRSRSVFEAVVKRTRKRLDEIMAEFLASQLKQELVENSKKSKEELPEDILTYFKSLESGDTQPDSDSPTQVNSFADIQANFPKEYLQIRESLDHEMKGLLDEIGSLPKLFEDMSRGLHGNAQLSHPLFKKEQESLARSLDEYLKEGTNRLIPGAVGIQIPFKIPAVLLEMVKGMVGKKVKAVKSSVKDDSLITGTATITVMIQPWEVQVIPANMGARTCQFTYWRWLTHIWVNLGPKRNADGSSKTMKALGGMSLFFGSVEDLEEMFSGYGGLSWDLSKKTNNVLLKHMNVKVGALAKASDLLSLPNLYVMLTAQAEGKEGKLKAKKTKKESKKSGNTDVAHDAPNVYLLRSGSPQENLSPLATEERPKVLGRDWNFGFLVPITKVIEIVSGLLPGN